MYIQAEVNKARLTTNIDSLFSDLGMLSVGKDIKIVSQTARIDYLWKPGKWESFINSWLEYWDWGWYLDVSSGKPNMIFSRTDAFRIQGRCGKTNNGWITCTEITKTITSVLTCGTYATDPPNLTRPEVFRISPIKACKIELCYIMGISIQTSGEVA